MIQLVFKKLQGKVEFFSEKKKLYFPLSRKRFKILEVYVLEFLFVLLRIVQKSQYECILYSAKIMYF